MWSIEITKTRTTPYHPQLDGMVKRFTQMLLNMLSTTFERKGDWDLMLPSVLLVYRTSTHKTTGSSPFQLMFGGEARLPVHQVILKKLLLVPVSVLELREKLRKMYQSANEHTDGEVKHQKDIYYRHSKAETYQPGQPVWLHCPHIPTERPHKLH